MAARASLTRRVTFSAAHRYRRPEWDEARNAATFGACARPNWHGHTYVCDVTVAGPVDPLTGFSADLGALDRALETRVVQALDHRNLVLDVPAFAEGKLIPTSENVAWWIAREVQAALGDTPRVVRVRLAEEPGLWAEVEPG
jgi:6-pyruvoyltetrahydropterin/6-carboxytetrahydropterin synthase